jgi:hypothetical protein
MKLAGSYVLLSAVTVTLPAEATPPAKAITTFEEYGGNGTVRPAWNLYEAACDLDVKLDGSVATVTMKQRIVNGGTAPLAAIYGFQLPAEAAITSFAVAQGKGAVAAKAIAVPASFRSAPVESADILGPDPALLRVAASGDGYEVVLQPIAPEHEVTLVTTYSAIATPRAGTLQLAIAGRKADKLAPCKGTVRATPGPSTAIRGIRVGGTSTPRAQATFAVGATDVVIAVELEVASTQPVVWQQSQVMPGGSIASLVTVLGPRIKGAGARRVVFVVDGSRSMDLVGRQHVTKVVKALGGALPSGAEIEAIVFDRTATRVFGEVRPANAQNLAIIENTIAKRVAANGSDIVKAFELARQVIDGSRGQAMVVVITDGVTAELPDQALIKALAQKTSSVDVHAIVLDPANTRSPGGKALRSPVNLYGGAYVEVNVDDLDDALGAIDEWMRPSWLELALGDREIPTEVRGGAGFVRLYADAVAPKLVLRGHGETRFEVAARPGPAAPIASLVQPIVTADRSLVVLATTGRIAKNRTAMIAGGGRYERSIAIKDPERAAPPAPAPATVPATPIARLTLERLFRDQLHPKAFSCYQRALGKNPKLGGTVGFHLRMGRGEVTHVEVKGLGDPGFEACLLDAAYAITPPLPDFTVNADDQTIANYPLTFNAREDKPVVVLGDADSVSPIDIDAVEGGVPVPARRKQKVKVETKTPLGNMKAPKSP